MRYLLYNYFDYILLIIFCGTNWIMSGPIFGFNWLFEMCVSAVRLREEKDVYFREHLIILLGFQFFFSIIGTMFPYLIDKRAKEHFIAIKIMEEQQEDLSQRNQEMEDIINAIPDPITIKDNSNIVFEN